MDPKIMEIGGELQKLLGDCWEVLCITAGINAGFFDILSEDNPVNIEAVAQKYGYDPEKVERWFYFSEQYNFIKKTDNGYILSEKGKFFTPHTPMKDLVGMFRLTSFFISAVTEANETFKKNKSLDTLSEGKISRDYQPRVSDNFSAALISFFKKERIEEKDSLLDFGCGHGNFLRILTKQYPNIQLCGIDSNIFAIEEGKKENQQLGLDDRINLIVDEVTGEMKEFEPASYDWATAINLLLYIPANKRMNVINNMMRIARKGIFITESIIEASLISAAGDVLMQLFFNDYTGEFKQKDAEDFNQYIKKQYPKYNFKVEWIMQKTTMLLIITKT